MRTNIFNVFTNLDQDFRDDFGILWNLPEDQRFALIPYISELTKVETTSEAKKVMDRAVSEIGGNASDLLRALKLLQFISAQWNPISDTPENFLRDLSELSLLPTDKPEESSRFLLEFLGEIQKDNRRRLQKMHAGALLPSFIGITTLIDFRAVMEHPFGTGLDDTLETYEPRCIGFAPVILVGIQTDSGEPKSYKFQCEPDDLRILIERLQAALMDLESAQLSLPGGTT